MPTIECNTLPDINGHFLSGETLNFSVTSDPPQVGTNYSYEWYVNSTLVGIGNTYSYKPNDLDSVEMRQINCDNITNEIKVSYTSGIPATAANAGTFSYVADTNGSRLYMSMKTSDNIYTWVLIQVNIWT